jgi:hypothetical protein
MGVENKMLAGGWGEQMPTEPGANASARQKNRRVEIYAMAPEGRSGHTTEASPPSGAGRGTKERALTPAPTPAPRTSTGRVAPTPSPVNPSRVP